MKNIFFTAESVKWKITDLISENLTESDLESKSSKGRSGISMIWVPRSDVIHIVGVTGYPYKINLA